MLGGKHQTHTHQTHTITDTQNTHSPRAQPWLYVSCARPAWWSWQRGSWGRTRPACSRGPRWPAWWWWDPCALLERCLLGAGGAYQRETLWKDKQTHVHTYTVCKLQGMTRFWQLFFCSPEIHSSSVLKRNIKHGAPPLVFWVYLKSNAMYGTLFTPVRYLQ